MVQHIACLDIQGNMYRKFMKKCWYFHFEHAIMVH